MSEDRKESGEADKIEPIRVLIAQDDPNAELSLEEAASEVGDYECIHPEDMADALRILEDESIDLIISDFQFSGNARGGLEIMKKAKEKNPARRSILFSTRALEFEGASEKELEEMGINLIIDKFSPLSPEDFKKCFKDEKKTIKEARLDWQIPKK